jgi:hypothetical protein
VSSAGLSKWRLAYEISPILLTNGIASGVSGGLPIISLTDAAAYDQGILSSSNPNAIESLDDFFAHFSVIPQGSLIKTQTAKYPFANQQVAANAIIFQPNNISLRMSCPVKTAGGYASKLSTITNLQTSLTNHINLGGTFTVVTPFFPYTNCLLLNLLDISTAETKQPQWDFQWDFEIPLLTLQQAQQAYGSLINQMQSGGAVMGDPPQYSGSQAIQNNPAALGTASTIPAAQGLPAAATAPPSPNQPISLPFNIGAP